MTRQIVHPRAELEIIGNAGMTYIESRLIKVFRHRVVCAAPLPMTNETGEFGELLFIKAECFSHFPCSGAATVSNHICCHGRTKRAIMLVDVLNDAFAMIAGWKIKIDVGPFASVLAEETLKQ